MAGEYFDAAHDAGLRPDLFEDVSARTREFWTLTLALAEAEMREGILSAHGSVRGLKNHLKCIVSFRQGLYDGGLRYALASFVEDQL
jgi:hypothetical protein